MTPPFGEFSLSGIATATLSAIIIYQLSGRRRTAAA